jgi:hypothetical protein
LSDAETLRCPKCGSTNYAVDPPGRLRCLARVMIDAVPPGLGGNHGLTPIPIYGDCGMFFTEQEAREAAAAFAHKAERRQAQAQEVERHRREQAAAEADLERRYEATIIALKAAGNPGLQQRRVPGRYYLSPVARFFGRVGKEGLVDVEAAWPIGTVTWIKPAAPHGCFFTEDLPTGYTPSRRIVPMDYATTGDDVEAPYQRRRLVGRAELWSDHIGGPDRHEIRPVRRLDITEALERILVHP